MLELLVGLIEAYVPEAIGSVLLVEPETRTLRTLVAPETAGRLLRRDRRGGDRPGRRIVRDGGRLQADGRRRGHRRRPALGVVPRARSRARAARLLVDADRRRRGRGDRDVRALLRRSSAVRPSATSSWSTLRPGSRASCSSASEQSPRRPVRPPSAARSTVGIARSSSSCRWSSTPTRSTRSARTSSRAARSRTSSATRSRTGTPTRCSSSSSCIPKTATASSPRTRERTGRTSR